MLLDAALKTAQIVPLTIGVIALCFLVAFVVARSSGFMGLRLKSINDPADGTLHVVSASLPPFNASASNYSLAGVIQAPGITATSITHSGLASTSKWPRPGDDLPVTVERTQPTKFIIRWDEVDSSSTQATRLADQLAQSINHGQTTGAQPVAGGPPLGTSSVVIDLRHAPAPGGPALGGPAAAGAGDDVGLLEKLSELHQKGALSDDEFAEQKAKILGSGA